MPLGEGGGDRRRGADPAGAWSDLLHQTQDAVLATLEQRPQAARMIRVGAHKGRDDALWIGMGQAQGLGA